VFSAGTRSVTGVQALPPARTVNLQGCESDSKNREVFSRFVGDVCRRVPNS